jgi:hypothetical protein
MSWMQASLLTLYCLQLAEMLKRGVVGRLSPLSIPCSRPAASRELPPPPLVDDISIVP